MPISATRALRQNFSASPELPRVSALHDVYEYGWKPRQGQMIMVAGAPGMMKSLLAMYWVAQMGLPTLYFAADTSPFDTSMRLAAMTMQEPQEQVEEWVKHDDHRLEVEKALGSSNIHFSFGSPLNWPAIDQELEAWVEVNNTHPAIVVFDNLMDFEGGEADYAAQMENQQLITDLRRNTGITTVVLHHASEAGFDDPTMPPPRRAIKNKLGEKPESTLTVAVDPNTMAFRIAVVKNRNGRQDPSAQDYMVLRAQPEVASFRRI